MQLLGWRLVRDADFQQLKSECAYLRQLGDAAARMLAMPGVQAANKALSERAAADAIVLIDEYTKQRTEREAAAAAEAAKKAVDFPPPEPET